VKAYSSELEILNDPELRGNPHLSGQLISQFRQAHPEQPAPRPVPDAAEEREINDPIARIVRERDDSAALDAKQKKYTDLLPNLVNQLRVLEATVEPDGPADNILELVIMAGRVKQAQEFLANIGPRKEAIHRRLIGLFHRANSAIQKFTDQRFHLNGSSLDACVNPLLAAVKQILKK